MGCTNEPEEVELKVASKVLRDAADAITRLVKQVEADGGWRIDYVAAVALLRAVGHVLDKVDGRDDPEARRRIDARWKAMRADPTFTWIEGTRNEVLKDYDIRADLTKEWEWTGDAATPEQATDAREAPTLLLSDSDEPAVARLWQTWRWWCVVLSDIQFDRRSKWPAAAW